MSPTQPLPPKKEVALALLETSSVFVHLDPRGPQVIVPPGFKKQPQLVLQVGLNMKVPIPDLRLDDEGMSCTLSFKGTRFFCVVPWPSVFAMVDEDARGMVWPDDVPAEVARQAQGRAAVNPEAKEAAKPSPPRDTKSSDPSKPKRPRKRPALAAVPDDEEEEALEAAAEAPPPPGPASAAAARPAVVPLPEARSSDEGGAASNAPRRRRELPPYLRVVK